MGGYGSKRKEWEHWQIHYIFDELALKYQKKKKKKIKSSLRKRSKWCLHHTEKMATRKCRRLLPTMLKLSNFTSDSFYSFYFPKKIQKRKVLCSNSNVHFDNIHQQNENFLLKQTNFKLLQFCFIFPSEGKIALLKTQPKWNVNITCTIIFY